MKQAVGLIGWRGMVGSVLMQRMREENDFDLFEPVFFSTSNAGGAAPDWADGVGPLQDAYDIETLKKLTFISFWLFSVLSSLLLDVHIIVKMVSVLCRMPMTVKH